MYFARILHVFYIEVEYKRNTNVFCVSTTVFYCIRKCGTNTRICGVFFRILLEYIGCPYGLRGLVTLGVGAQKYACRYTMIQLDTCKIQCIPFAIQAHARIHV